VVIIDSRQYVPKLVAMMSYKNERAQWKEEINSVANPVVQDYYDVIVLFRYVQAKLRDYPMRKSKEDCPKFEIILVEP